MSEMLSRENKNLVIKFFVIITGIFLISGCSPTKYLQEGEYLLDKVELKCDNKDISDYDLEAALRQKANKKILGYSFYARVYNLVNPQKEEIREERRRKKEAEINERRKLKAKRPKEKFYLTRWIRQIGESPVVYSEELTQRSLRNIRSFLQTQSYYNNSVSYSVKNISKKRVILTYDIKTGPAYVIKEIVYDVLDPKVLEIIQSDTVNSLVRYNSKLNTNNLQSERERVLRLLRTKGYYYFNLNNIHYFVDTLNGHDNVKLTFTIRKEFGNDDITENTFTTQKINRVFIHSDYDLNLAITKNQEYFAMLDTIIVEGIQIIYRDKLRLKPNVLLQACFIKPGNLYNIEDIEKTHTHLSSLRQFKNINIVLRQPDDLVLNSLKEKNLDVYIYLTPLDKQNINFELEGNNTSGNIGMSGGISYLNRNIVKGAQIFNAKGNLSFQTMFVEDTIRRSYFFNTLEYGAELRLTIPRLLLPFSLSPEFIKRSYPRTNLFSTYSYQQRPDYTRSILNAGFGYSWKSGRNNYFTNNISPITINFVKIFDFNPIFLEQIKHLYIRYSYEDQLITSLNYSLVFSNQKLTKHEDFTYIWLNFESSGNVLSSVYKIAGIPKIDSTSYRFMGIEFSQFIKADLDFRRYNFIGESQQIVYRAYFGIGLPYGNSTKGLPFTKKYFIGGANDIRAWKVREVGPGSYFNPDRTFDQIADMKIMFNAEYRFPIFSYFKGALFLDAGNIWAVDKNDNRAEALFDLYRFYKEFALGTGIGTRIDLTFFVVRFDFGIPLYDPRYDEGNRWFTAFKDFGFKQFTVNFGIGYPF
jgi:outer membrane protein assembly factor BamA